MAKIYEFPVNKTRLSPRQEWEKVRREWALNVADEAKLNELINEAMGEIRTDRLEQENND